MTGFGQRRVTKKLSLEKFGLEVGLNRCKCTASSQDIILHLKPFLKLAIALETKPDILIKSNIRFNKDDLDKLVNGIARRKNSENVILCTKKYITI